MNGIANSPNVLAAIRERKLAVKEQLQTSRTTMLENVRSHKCWICEKSSIDIVWLFARLLFKRCNPA